MNSERNETAAAPDYAQYSTVQSQRGAAPDPLLTDALAMGWMQGFPPPADKIIRFDSGSAGRFPELRWSFSHSREIVPTSNVWRGTTPVSTLESAPMDLDALEFFDERGQATRWDAMLSRSFTDSIVVLHEGRIIYERYFGAAKAHLPHRAFSVTKSFVGVLAGLLVGEGRLDVDAPVTQYIPELSASAWSNARVRHLLDMSVGIRYSEVYTDPSAEIWQYARAGGMLPVPPGYEGPRGFYEFLPTLSATEGAHGDQFSYKTVNTEVLGWILRRVSGQSLSALLSERLWQPLGMEEDAYFEVDSAGTEGAGGGLNLTVRDMARFGEMVRLGGLYHGKQILPSSLIDDIRSGGNVEQFARAGYQDTPGFPKGAAYRDQWWVSNNSFGAFDARGIYGQRIYINPKAALVLARFGSHHIASNMGIAPYTDRAYEALAQHLMG